MTEDIREKMIASFEKTFDLPAFLAARGFVVPGGERDPRHVEMVLFSTGETLLLRKDLDSGAWSYQNAHHPEDRGRASHYFEAHDRLSRDESLDHLIALATERNLSEEAVAYRRTCREKPQSLREMEARHVVGVNQEKSAQTVLRAYGVEPQQVESGRFGQLWTPSDLDRLVRDPQRLGASAYRPTDTTIVLTERPLDAIGYERAKGDGNAYYLYTGSTLSPNKVREIAQVFAELPASMKVVLAFGRDEGGRDLAARVQGLAPSTKMERETPGFGARWADQMQIEQRHAASSQRGRGSDLVAPRCWGE
jgi:hypothetical protein